MKLRHFVNLALLAAVAALAVWIARNTSWVDTDVPMPPSGEAARNPFYAAQVFAEALGATTHHDGTLVLPAANGVLVAANWNWALTPERRGKIVEWVEAGGRLVVDASLIDAVDELAEWSGIERVDPDADDESLDAGEEKTTSERECRALIEYGTDADRDHRRRYTLCGMDRTQLTSEDDPAWELSDDSGIYALRMNLGRGAVTMVRATPFGNRELFDGDDAAVLVAAAGLRGGDDVRFLYEEDPPSLLALTWRYGSPVIVLSALLLALALVRGGLRFGPLAAPVERGRRSLAEQIRGTGLFALRYGDGAALVAAAARALHEAGRRRIPAYERLSERARIESVARATGMDAADIGRAIQSRAASAGEVANAVAQIEAARRKLQETERNAKHGT